MGDSDFSTEGFIIEEKKPPNPLVVSSNGANYTSNNNVWPTLKPFVNGFLAGELTFLQFCGVYWCCKEMLPPEKVHDRLRLNYIKMNNTLHSFRKLIPARLLFEATYTTARFGSFDILTKKVEAANDGLPLTLYQEACCGLISGGIAASIWHPLNVASASLRVKPSQSVATQFNYGNLFASLYHRTRSEGLFALWKGSGGYIPRQMAINMGSLTSYNRSLCYFRESVGLSKSDARLGAGIVSAFFAAACSFPLPYIVAIKDIIKADGGRKYSNRDALFVILQVLQPGGQYKFYSGIFKSFLQFIPYVMIQWANLEDIRDFEESAGF